MPCFPPSYKRKKGDTEGECGDYTDPLKIIQGFTNTGEVQELLRDGEVRYLCAYNDALRLLLLQFLVECKQCHIGLMSMLYVGFLPVYAFYLLPCQ